jgi:branched-chain amino acid transport system substrate-binding protein
VSSGAPEAGPGCAKNAECHVGEICQKDQGRCVALQTDWCQVLAEKGDVENDRTIWVGAMFPTTGPIAPIGGPSMKAVDLARRDFVELAHGIPSHSVDGAPRPLGIIACNDDDHEQESARHLADDVGVPAVIGFKTSAESTALTRDVFLPKRTFVATTNQSLLATTMLQPADSPRLVWRTATNSTQSSVAVARVIADLLEPKLRASSVVTNAKPMRVALIHSKSGSTLARAEALVSNVRFNEKGARANGHDFAELVYADPTGGARPDWGVIVAGIVELRPHVVIYVDEVDDMVDSMLVKVEKALPADAAPYWVSTTNLRGEALFRFLGHDAARRRRFFGVSEPADAPANAQLAARYAAVFDTSMSTNDTPAPPYDAAYLVAYAAYIVGDAPVTGAALASAIERLLPPGEPIDVGPTHIYDAIRALQGGGHIDLNGAAYSFDYDLKTGEAPVNYVIQCVGVDGKGFANDAIDSGLTLDAHGDKLRGTMHCP